MTDEEIVSLYWQRDEAAIEHTESKYGTYCRTIAYHVLKDAEDTKECVNDTWLRTWNAIPPGRPQSLKLFLAKITRNLAFDRYKAANAKKRGGGEMPVILDELSECIPSGSNVESEVMARVLGDRISAFLSGLRARDSALFVRRYFYAESMEEIAARYHITRNTAAVSLNRTRNKLKKFLIEEGFTI